LGIICTGGSPSITLCLFCSLSYTRAVNTCQSPAVFGLVQYISFYLKDGQCFFSQEDWQVTSVYIIGFVSPALAALKLIPDF